jgi:hypothetical protein
LVPDPRQAARHLLQEPLGEQDRDFHDNKTVAKEIEIGNLSQSFWEIVEGWMNFLFPLVLDFITWNGGGERWVWRPLCFASKMAYSSITCTFPSHRL